MTENLPATKEQNEIVPISTTSIFLNMQRFADAQRVAGMLAASTLIPEHFRNNIGNCVIALNLAERLNVDPFMMMQTMYVVHGRPGIEGKLAIALVEGTGRFTPLKFKFSGTGKTDKGVSRPDECIAYATEIKTGEVIEGPPVTWEMAKAEGWLKDKGTATSKWQTMPDLMFRYRSAMFFARVNCPGALLGLRTTEEIEDTEPITLIEKADKVYALQNDDANENNDLIKAFEESIPADIDKEILDEFISKNAEINKSSNDDVKIEASKKPETFWKIYKAYEKSAKAKKEKELKAAEKKEPELAPAECPDNPGTTYTKAHCDECPKHPGCPVWETK